MNAAARILLSLDAHECWEGSLAPSAAESSVPGLGIEPLVIEHEVADAFGASAMGLYVSDDDLATAKAQWAARMQQLSAAYATFSPTWVARDPKAFADWTNDWTGLQARYKAALDNQGFFTLNSTSYESLLKAMRQCYPPDGCPVTKGDWMDLFNRLTAATKVAGAAPPVDVAAHLVPQTTGERLFADTAKLDVIASMTGAQAPGTALPSSLLDFLAWIKAHKTVLIVGGVVVVSGIALTALSPYIQLLMAPVKALKAVKGVAALAA